MRRPAEPPRRRPRPLIWTGTTAAVATIQGLLAAALSWPSTPPEHPAPAPIVMVELTPPPPPPAPTREASVPSAPSDPAPETAPRAPQPAPAPPVPAAAPRPPLRTPPPDTPVLAVQAATPGAPDLPLIGGAQLAGALASGGGHGGDGADQGNGAGHGGDCDMRARLEAALRGDARIRQTTAAVLAARGARGQAVLVWDGDWLQSPGEAGKGLAGVRQAIAVEVGFAPRACRDQFVRGLVAIPLDADPAGPKLALGAGHWRWRDLLAL